MRADPFDSSVPLSASDPSATSSHLETRGQAHVFFPRQATSTDGVRLVRTRTYHRTLLPSLGRQFLEDSFVLLPDPPLFNAGSASFIRKELECFSPRKLPKNFHLAEHRPARLEDEDYNKLNDVSSSPLCGPRTQTALRPFSSTVFRGSRSRRSGITTAQ